MKVTPTCKYGHGHLTAEIVQPATEKTRVSWGLLGAVESWADDDPGRTGPPQVSYSGHIFTLKLFRCPVCGYLELFDYEEKSGRT